MKRQRITAALAAAALLLTGCNSLSLNGRDILSPPQSAGNRAAIQDLITTDAGGSYNLLYPTSGDYKNCVIARDLDADGTEEIIAFYTKADGSAHALMAVQEDGSYHTTNSVELPSSHIDRVSFADLNGDGSYELLVGCDIGTADASLSAYAIDNTILHAEMIAGFTDYTTGDMNGDAADDILLLTPASVESPASADLMLYQNGTLVKQSSCETDPDVTSFASLSYGKISENLYGVAADGVTVSGDYTTQLFCYDASARSLVNPLLIYADYSKTLRSAALLSHDINSDGIIEIPLCSLMEYAKDEDPSAVCTVVDWCDYDSAQMALGSLQKAIICESMGFMLVIKPELIGTVTARYTDENAMTLYSMSYKDGQPILGKALLTVRRYDKSSLDTTQLTEAVLYENSTQLYTYIRNADGAGYTDEEVKTSFMLMNIPTI